MPLNSPGLSHENSFLQNAEKSRALASALFPGEVWIFKEPGIWVAESRLSEEDKEPDKWEREMSQVRILTRRGSVAYFLPERTMPGGSGERSADLVLDGVILEMKTTAGTRTTLGSEFKHGYRQGAALAKQAAAKPEHSVFIRLKTNLSLISVMSKIAGELKGRTGQGRFICYFETSGELYAWTYDELRAIIGKK
jgi:hypothetical protein